MVTTAVTSSSSSSSCLIRRIRKSLRIRTQLFPCLVLLLVLQTIALIELATFRDVFAFIAIGSERVGRYDNERPMELGLRPDGDKNIFCERALDKLEHTFNLKRLARQEARWEMLSEHDLQRKTFDLFEPEATCISDERLGGSASSRYHAFGDGPKFVCGVDVLAMKDDCLVYSIGSSNEIDFEVAIRKHMGEHCEVHTFDPSLNESTYVGANFSTFHSWGIGADEGKFLDVSSGMSFSTMSIETIMQKLGHTNRTIDIIKIDCEGCEYEALPHLLGSMERETIVVNQIQMEAHRRYPMVTREQVYEMFDAFDRAKMRIFHKERNHWGCDGYRCIEYAFASESFLRKANAQALFCDLETPSFGQA